MSVIQQMIATVMNPITGTGYIGSAEMPSQVQTAFASNFLLYERYKITANKASGLITFTATSNIGGSGTLPVGNYGFYVWDAPTGGNLVLYKMTAITTRGGPFVATATAPLVAGTYRMQSLQNQNLIEATISADGQITAAVTYVSTPTILNLPTTSLTALLMHFDNNLIDVKGAVSTNYGTTFSTDSRFSGYSAEFTSGNSFVINNVPGFAANEPFTIEFLFKPPVLAANTNTFIFCNAGDQNFMCAYEYQTGTHFISLTLNGIAMMRDLPGPLSDGNWHHIAFVRQSNGDLYCYVDGVSGAWRRTIDTYTKSTGNLRVGMRNDGYRPFTGKLDEFRISLGAGSDLYTSNFTPSTTSFPNP